jgi:ankyrin repeat protein
MFGSEPFGDVDSARDGTDDDNNDNYFDSAGSALGAAMADIDDVVRSPIRPVEVRTLPSSAPQRMSTPTAFTADERLVESWIQQSLTMPSSNVPDEAVGGDASPPFAPRMDAGMPATRHRRERSLGSEFFAESRFPGGAAAGLAGSSAFIPSRASNNSNDTASHPVYNAEFEASWSNHSASVPGEDLLGGLSSSATQSSPGLIAPDRPVRGPRVSSSTSPSREDDTSGTSSVIHDAARIINWQTVVDLCATNPEDAAYVGRDGWTALHHACNRRCPYPNVVEALIRAYPDALLVEEEKGWLPLHYACRFKAPKEVVRLLLHLYPEKGRLGVSRPDRKGRSPLYYAVRYDAPAGVIGLLLEVDASAVLEEDQNADSPLALVWDAWAEKMDGKRTLNKILGGYDEGSQHSIHSSSSSNNSNSLNGNPAPASPVAVLDLDPIEKARNVRNRLQVQAKVLERWNKVNVFLKAAFGFALDEDWEMVDSFHEEKKKDSPGSMSLPCSSNGRKWRILHALSAIKCHHSLFLLAAALHPEQAFEADKDDLKGSSNVHNPKCLENPSNATALHFAASSHASGDAGKVVLTHLLELNPGAAVCVDSQGSTPLHCIAGNQCKSNWRVDGVEELYNAHPGAARSVDANGLLPLHRAASAITYHHGLDDAVIMARSKIVRLLQENGDASHHPDNFGCLPLHLVAKYGRSWDVQVQALYDANTAAVRARTGVKYSNRLPLHFVAANIHSDFSLVSKLVELNPRGASQADRKGKLPLHLACEYGLSWESVQSIHQANPDAVQQPEGNGRGWMALHMAASAEKADNDLISNLVQLHPDAATVADSHGRFPLHLACVAGKSWENGLSSIFDANPEAIRCPDNEGLLPLHIVSLKCCAEDPHEIQPKVIDVRTLGLIRATSVEADQASAKNIQEAKQIGNLFNVLKADPTVLSK